MTTFQDPPPQSRRAVRQSERGETPSTAADEGNQYRFDSAASAPQAPAAHSPAAPAVQQVPTTPQTGRRAQQPTLPSPDVHQSAPAFEPLTYTTQGRVSPPVYEQNQQQPLSTAPPPVAPAPGFGSGPAFVAGQPQAGNDSSGYRVRDFSPEGGRRSAQPRESLPAESVEGAFSAPPAFPAPTPTRPVDLEYHTQAVAPTPSHTVAAQPIDDGLGHTLSRRELREMRAAAERQAQPLQMPEPIGTLLNSGPIEIPTLAPPPGQSQALAEAMAEFDLLTRARREAEARARDAQVASLTSQSVPTQHQPVTQQPLAADYLGQQYSAPAPVASTPVPSVASAPVAPVASVPQAPVFQASVPQPSVPQPPVAELPGRAPNLVFPPMDSAPAPAPVAPSAPAPFPFAMQTSAPVPYPTSAPVASTPVFSAPALPESPLSVPTSSPEPDEFAQDEHGGRSPRASNHWRVQAAKEDDELPYENTLSRTVGLNTSAITTSALVLPSVPQPDGILASLGSTGEILVTGSINLPSILGSTGAHPDRVDNSDDEDDPFDSQIAAPDSAPVRAIRAVSTSTSTRGVIETKRPQGNRLLTAVIIVASVLCVGLVGLLVFAFATNKL